MSGVRIAVIGCGNRGADVYARHLTEQGAVVTHLVEPRQSRLAEVAARFRIGNEGQLGHWDEFFALGKVTDAVVIATPDHQHVEPALRALELGYHVLLEKPICLDESDLDRLLAAEADSAGQVTVCHVLRHAPFFVRVAGVLDSGMLGQVVGIHLTENVASWHYAHSYVRGNWRSSPPAAPFILAKSCHDLDVLRWYAGAAPVSVGSAGALVHFRPENAPAGAAARCVDCAVPDCPYDARKIYLTRPADRWPVTVLTAGGHDLTTALARGPYGECVYRGKNNVVDHQSVTVTFGNGLIAGLTVSAFTAENTRTLKIMGSHGELRGHMDHGEIEVRDFSAGTSTLRPAGLLPETSGNHGGGDVALIARWLAFLRGQAGVPTPLAESVDSHRMAFAAERARKGNGVEKLGEEFQMR